MIADRNQENLIATFRFLDDDGSEITSLVWNTPGIEIGYKKYGATAWTNLTLVSGTAGTYLSSSFVADPDGDGLYEIGVPNESKVAGHRTVWRFKYGAFQYRYDSIDYVSIPSAETSNVTFEFAIPGVDVITSNAPSIYVKEQGIQVVFTANQDVSAIPLVVIFEDDAGTDSYVIKDEDLVKSGDTVTLTLPIGFTDEELSLTWGIRNRDTLRVYGTGTISVTYAPYEG
jgi:hypothetical protein